jgi:hypothetical protein
MASAAPSRSPEQIETMLRSIDAGGRSRAELPRPWLRRGALAAALSSDTRGERDDLSTSRSRCSARRERLAPFGTQC